MHGLAAQYQDQMVFTYLDIDDPATDIFKETLQYRVQPHMFLLDGEGNVVQEWLGFVAEAELVEAFEKALADG